MAKIIAIANHKGGVAKTTSYVNIVADLEKMDIVRYVALSDEMPEDRFSVGIWVWQ
jgi:chromosome partitioning protein